MSEELKPCPFCGGEARAFRCEESGTFDVQCQQCGAIPFIGSRTSEKKTMDDVIAAWNARAAVTDEQFSLAVHDGRAWEPVRTCGEWRGDLNPEAISDFAAHEGYELWCEYCDIELEPDWAYCPNCGAKVAR